MAWTYAAAPGTATADQRRDAVRLEIGDTDTNDQQLQNEEIAYYLSQAGDKIVAAAALAAQALASKYSRQVNTTHGKLRVDASDRFRHYQDLARDLTQRAIAGGGSSAWFVGGITESGKERLAADDDAIQPMFERGMDEPVPNDDESIWRGR